MPCSYEYTTGTGHQRCGFNAAENDVVEFAGRSWCKFHLPVSNDDLVSEKASWTVQQKTAFVQELSSTKDIWFGVIFPPEFDIVLVDKPTSTSPNQLVINPEEMLFDCRFHSKVTGILGSLRIIDATFHKDAEFTFAHQGHSPNRAFVNVKFLGTTKIKCDYHHTAIFEDVQFGPESATLRCFDLPVGFSMDREQTIFSGRFLSLSFSNVRFCTITSFVPDNKKAPGNAIGSMSFSHVEFLCSVHFSGRYADDKELVGSLHFEQAIFRRNALFTYRRICGSTEFVDTTFFRAPDFSNSELHPLTAFTHTHFLDETPQAAERYRVLKQRMAELGNRANEGMFYALEKRSERRRTRKLSEKSFSWLYEAVSDYGNSIVRPIVALFIIFLLFTEVYEANYVAAMPYLLPLELWPALKNSLAFSFQQTVAPFLVWRSDPWVMGMQCTDEHCLGLRVVASIQSVLSISIITLWLLSLRWHFKRD